MYNTRNEPANWNATAFPPLDTMPDQLVLQEKSMFSSQPPPVSGQSSSFSPVNELWAIHPLFCVSDFECRTDIGYAAAVQAQIAGPRAEVALQDTLPSPFSWKHIYGQAITMTRCPRRRTYPPTCCTSSFKDRTHTRSPNKSSIAPQDLTTTCTISGCLHSPTPGVIEIVRMPVLGALAGCVICHHMVLFHFHSICCYSPHQLHCLLTMMPAGRIVVIIQSHK